MERRVIGTEKAIERVLLTPLGSRVMRPLFGSRLFELIDRPLDTGYRLDAVEWSAEAIERSLPQVQVKKVDVEKDAVTLLVEDDQGELEVRVAFA